MASSQKSEADRCLRAEILGWEQRQRIPGWDTQAAESKAMAKLPLAPRGEAEPRSNGQEAGLGQGAGDKECPVRSGVGVRAVGSIGSGARLRL